MQLKHALLAGTAVVLLASYVPGGETRKLLDPANMDLSVKPGDNFFLYANGTWLKNNPIPASETRWGSFNELQENNYKALHTLLDSAASVKNAPKGSIIQKVGDFYRTGMDSDAINKMGLQPLQGVLSRINNVKNTKELITEITREHTEGIGQVFSFGISPDDKHVTKEICQFGQGGLGMPGREYYFDNDARTVKIREAYQQYIPKMLVLMGEGQLAAETDAKAIYQLELSLADSSMTRVDMRDPYKLYNKYDLKSIDKLTPGIDWKTLLTGLRVNNEDTVIVGMPAFFEGLSKNLSSVPLDTWKKYLSFHLVNDMAPYLSASFDTTRFAFYGKTMRGQKAQRVRWKRIMQVVDGAEGELLGQLYVSKYFKPEAKKRMLELVNNLQATYAERINKLDWMSAETKKKALIKLNAFMKKIGYPNKWKDYTALTVVNNDFVKNIMASSAWEYNYELHKLGRAVDRTEWGMTPPTVNAYYNPAFNEIVFPAGILQYPFFDEHADDAVNYGGIGAVIGHEMTHGFDDQGRLYNAEGNLSNWWTPQDSANFVAKANMVVDQFNKMIVIDTSHANGSLTEGENLADLGGLNIAYEAFKKTKEGKSSDKIDGFTPDQRFFLSWAQVWRANTRPEELASRLKTDPHSPSELRCNVPISNMEAWYKAFSIQPTDKFYKAPADRARVW
jgi:putative endopeptidase